MTSASSCRGDGGPSSASLLRRACARRRPAPRAGPARAGTRSHPRAAAWAYGASWKAVRTSSAPRAPPRRRSAGTRRRRPALASARPGASWELPRRSRAPPPPAVGGLTDAGQGWPDRVSASIGVCAPARQDRTEGDVRYRLTCVQQRRIGAPEAGPRPPPRRHRGRPTSAAPAPPAGLGPAQPYANRLTTAERLTAPDPRATGVPFPASRPALTAPPPCAAACPRPPEPRRSARRSPLRGHAADRRRRGRPCRREPPS